jgi:hypothetical protein
VAALYTVSVFILLLFCGLTLDYGMLEFARGKMQNAADAAAVAEELYFERSSSSPTGSDPGKGVASQYGFTDGSNNTTVSYLANNLINSDQGGAYAGQYDGLQIQISQTMPTMFMKLANIPSVTVTVNSVAAIPACAYFLGLKGWASPTVSLNKGGNRGEVYLPCSAYIGGGASLDGTVDWWQAWQTYLTGTSSGTTTNGGRWKSGATYNSTTRADPLSSYISAPTVGACNHTNFSSGNLSGSATSVTLNPGVYCGSVSGSTVTPGLTLLNDTVTVNPGLYIITGGANWERATMTQTGASGTGVTFYFTNVSGHSTSFGGVLINDLSSLTLSAANGGTFGSSVSGSGGALAGVLFYLDRGWVHTNAQDFNFNSAAGTTNGVWYLPDTGITFLNGSDNCSTMCGIVTDNMSLTNWELSWSSQNFADLPGGNPFRLQGVLVQ